MALTAFRRFRSVRLTIFGRSLLLISCEILTNAICWAVTAILFRDRNTRNILSLALLAWTLGLRHALDADHISAIDNATRSLMNTGQMPVTCGLFFSLGHSTIVIIVTVAIAISTSVYDHISGVGKIGGIVGAAVSGAFLFIVGLANSFILWRILRQRRREKRRLQRIEHGEAVEDEPLREPEKNSMLMMRILGPIVTFVNRPWKMYPVGVLFGLGFDTASSIALLAVSAIAKQGSDKHAIPSSHVIILPLLFTAGMTFIDSLDSILMLYSYAGLLENPSKWRIIEPQSTPSAPVQQEPKAGPEGTGTTKDPDPQTPIPEIGVALDERVETETRVKMNMMSGLSIVLTLMSIMVAFAISLITIMSLIGEQCSQCAAAAKAEDGGGLAGAWWRGWANAGEHSGFIGVGIVGAVLVIVVSWYLGSWIIRWVRQCKPSQSQVAEECSIAD